MIEEEEATEDIEEIDLRSADFMLSHNIQDLMDTTSRYFFYFIFYHFCFLVICLITSTNISFLGH